MRAKNSNVLSLVLSNMCFDAALIHNGGCRGEECTSGFIVAMAPYMTWPNPSPLTRVFLSASGKHQWVLLQLSEARVRLGQGYRVRLGQGTWRG